MEATSSLLIKKDIVRLSYERVHRYRYLATDILLRDFKNREIDMILQLRGWLGKSMTS